ncbi:DNA mismatch repair protein MutS [Staphylococcus gallinarum]|uniref:DNA mismatch repair protein MutS n=1 Tax=Staphylococcus gallinarum TaxID=1293 RepID=A0A380FHL9_STAGA|nr:DNA mismatch repair protein MutS [Staphylococcus gallinarum]
MVFKLLKLANLPDAVISRAQVILDAFEKSDQLHDNQVVVNKVEVLDESSHSADDATNQDLMEETVSSDQSHAIFRNKCVESTPRG